MFRKYHYLSHVLPNSSHCHVAIINGVEAGFISYSRFPHPKVKNIMRICRLVVKPDFQGIGLGGKMLDFIAEYLKNDRIRIVTSQPALIYFLKKNDKWICADFGRKFAHTGSLKSKNKTSQGSCVNRITATFEYKKNINK